MATDGQVDGWILGSRDAWGWSDGQGREHDSSHPYVNCNRDQVMTPPPPTNTHGTKRAERHRHASKHTDIHATLWGNAIIRLQLEKKAPGSY